MRIARGKCAVKIEIVLFRRLMLGDNAMYMLCIELQIEQNRYKKARFIHG